MTTQREKFDIVKEYTYQSILPVLEEYTGHFWVHFKTYYAFETQQSALLWLGSMMSNENNCSTNVLLNKPVITPIHSIKSDDLPDFLTSFKRDIFMIADDHRWIQLWGTYFHFVKVIKK